MQGMLHLFMHQSFRYLVLTSYLLFLGVILISVQRLKRMLESALNCEELSGKKWYPQVVLKHITLCSVDQQLKIIISLYESGSSLQCVVPVILTYLVDITERIVSLQENAKSALFAIETRDKEILFLKSKLEVHEAVASDGKVGCTSASWVG